MSDDLGAVYNLLKSKEVYFISSGRDYLTKCMNPEHEDSDPSMRINKVTGATHCFSCGFKANIFKHFGILTNPVSVRIAKLKDKLAAIKYDSDGLDMLDGAVPYNQSFRGISSITLKKFKAFVVYNNEDLDSRIIFPITDLRGKIRLFIARHTLSNANPRYIVTPKEAKLLLFPPSLEIRGSSIVLVEGIFDFLNVYDKGLTNAVCTFGTNTLSNDIKPKLLPFKAQGVTHIFIMFDGDIAGEEGAEKLKPIVESLGFITEIIKLQEGQDPGNLGQEDVTSLYEYTRGKSINE